MGVPFSVARAQPVFQTALPRDVQQRRDAKRIGGKIGEFAGGALANEFIKFGGDAGVNLGERAGKMAGGLGAQGLTMGGQYARDKITGEGRHGSGIAIGANRAGQGMWLGDEDEEVFALSSLLSFTRGDP